MPVEGAGSGFAIDPRRIHPDELLRRCKARRRSRYHAWATARITKQNLSALRRAQRHRARAKSYPTRTEKLVALTMGDSRRPASRCRAFLRDRQSIRFLQSTLTTGSGHARSGGQYKQAKPRSSTAPFRPTRRSIRGKFGWAAGESPRRSGSGLTRRFTRRPERRRASASRSPSARRGKSRKI